MALLRLGFRIRFGSKADQTLHESFVGERLDLFANQIANQPRDTVRYYASQTSTVGPEIANWSTRLVTWRARQHENLRTRKPLYTQAYRGFEFPPSPPVSDH